MNGPLNEEERYKVKALMRETEREAERHTDRQTHRHTDRHTDSGRDMEKLGITDED